jgi:hypothetical protein
MFTCYKRLYVSVYYKICLYFKIMWNQTSDGAQIFKNKQPGELELMIRRKQFMKHLSEL